ncbi:hypothetical protein DIPPA_33393 [Diplonema papillatum]|nr:hypothetical protein DIPPA_33393 [Diplonema papillatum]|eukprot:gene11825-18243_t
MKSTSALAACLLVTACRGLVLMPECEVTLGSLGGFLTVVDDGTVALTASAQTFSVVASLGLFALRAPGGRYLGRDGKLMVTYPDPSNLTRIAFTERPSGGHVLSVVRKNSPGLNVTECPAKSCSADQLGFKGQDTVVFEVTVVRCRGDFNTSDWAAHPLSEPYLPPVAPGWRISLMPDMAALRVCDDCVEPGVKGSVVAGGTGGPPPLFTVKDQFNGFFALQTETGAFLRMCGDCYAGQTRPVLVADGTDPTDPAAHFAYVAKVPANLVGRPPIVLKNGEYLSPCGDCLPGVTVLAADPIREKSLYTDVYAGAAPLLPYCNGRGYAVRRSVTQLDTELPTADLLAAADFAASDYFPLSLLSIPAALAAGGVTQPRELPEPAGTQLVLDCCGAAACDFYVSVYRCSGCPSDNGGLPLALLSGDEPWAAGACAPRFSKPRSVKRPFARRQHPMHTFHKRVAAGEVLVLDPLAAPAETLVIFGSQAASPGANDWCPVIVQQGPFPVAAPCARRCFQP